MISYVPTWPLIILPHEDRGENRTVCTLYRYACIILIIYTNTVYVLCAAFTAVTEKTLTARYKGQYHGCTYYIHYYCSTRLRPPPRMLHTYSIYRHLHYIIRFESRLYVFIIIIIICTSHWIALYADRPLWLYWFYWNEEKRRSGSPGRLWRLRYYILLLLLPPPKTAIYIGTASVAAATVAHATSAALLSRTL